MTRARALLGALAALIALAVLVAGRGTTWAGGEWTWLVERGSIGSDALLAPSGGALVALPVAVLEAALSVGGLDGGYGVARVVVLVAHLALAAAVLGVLRERAGWLGAAVAAALVLVLGRAGDELLRVGALGGTLAALGGLVAVAAARRRDGAALVALGLAVALASSSVGLAFALVVGVELLARERPPAGRVVALVVPLALYALWVALEGGRPLDAGRVPELADAGAAALASASGGLVGQGRAAGWAVLVVALAGLGWLALTRPRPVPRGLGALAGLALAAVLVGLAPEGSATTAGATTPISALAVLALLALAQLVPRGVTAALPARRVALVATAGVLLAALGGWGALVVRGGALRDDAQELRARLGASSLVADRLAADTPVVPGSETELAGPLLALQREHGRLGDTRAQLATGPLAAGSAADDTLRRAGALSLVDDGRASGDGPVFVGGSAVRVQRVGGPCVQVSLVGGAPSGRVDVQVVPGSRITLEGTRPTALFAWRFGAPPSERSFTVPKGRTTFGARADAGGGDPVAAWVARLGITGLERICSSA